MCHQLMFRLKCHDCRVGPMMLKGTQPNYLSKSIRKYCFPRSHSCSSNGFSPAVTRHVQASYHLLPSASIPAPAPIPAHTSSTTTPLQHQHQYQHTPAAQQHRYNISTNTSTHQYNNTSTGTTTTPLQQHQ